MIRELHIHIRTYIYVSIYVGCATFFSRESWTPLRIANAIDKVGALLHLDNGYIEFQICFRGICPFFLERERERSEYYFLMKKIRRKSEFRNSGVLGEYTNRSESKLCNIVGQEASRFSAFKSRERVGK